MKNVYLVTFDANDNIVVHSGGTISSVFSASEIAWNVDQNSSNTTPVKVNPQTKKILVVTSPGPVLKEVLEQPFSGGSVTNFTQLNQALTIAFDNQQQKTEELVNEVREIKSGSKAAGTAEYQYFTMINSGYFIDPAYPTDPDRQKIDGVNSALIPVVKVSIVGEGTGEFGSDDAAKEDAKKYPTIVKIERLAAKVQVKSETGILTGNASGGKLIWPSAGDHWLKADGYWTLDVVNSTFFPYAKKHNSTTTGTPTDFYQWAFYTEDPNYRDADIVYPSGLKYNNLYAKTFAPKVTWLGDDFDYAIENTMEANSQLFKLATRIVVRGYYWPADVRSRNGDGLGDWFRYGGKNYATLDELKNGYTDGSDVVMGYAGAKAIVADPNAHTPEVVAFAQGFVAACDHFVKQVVAQAKALNVTIAATSASTFDQLSQTADLDMIVNGGELVKNSHGCIRWYQKGLNYWYYEMRHDDGANSNMQQDKYGVVRNNWYDLTMSSISNHGTPWYPSIIPDQERPDPNDPDTEYDPEEDPDPDPIPDPEDPYDPTPDPEDPLDNDSGYLDFKIKIGPWVYWQKDMPLE